MLKTIVLTESKNEPLPPHASFSAASWFHLAGLCVKARSCEWLPSAKTVGFRCARVQIACPAKQIGYRVLLHTSGSCRPKRARIRQEKKLYLSLPRQNGAFRQQNHPDRWTSYLRWKAVYCIESTFRKKGKVCFHLPLLICRGHSRAQGMIGWNWRQCTCQTCFVLTQHDPTCSRKPED